MNLPCKELKRIARDNLNGNYKITCENEYCAKNTLANVIKKDMEVDLTKSWYTENDR